MTTTSGSVSATTCTASRPSAADPTTSTSSRLPSSATSPSRTIWWSSTTTTLTSGHAVLPSTSPRRQPRSHDRAARRRAGDLAASAELGRAFAQRHQAHARLGGRRDPGAVVGHLDQQRVAVPAQPHGALGGRSVPVDVGHRLPGDAEGGDLHRRRQGVEVVGQHDACACASGRPAGSARRAGRGRRARAGAGRGPGGVRRPPRPARASASRPAGSWRHRDRCRPAAGRLSSWKTTPLIAGPSPSCRSRRIRRRSSSRATTSRSRLSCSSSVSRLVRTAVAAWRTRSPSSRSSRPVSRLRRPRRGSSRRPTSAPR